MFEEGDWNDDVEARALTDAVFHTHRLHPSSVAPSAHSKKKRRKLLETLRALKAAGWPGGEPGSEAGWRNRRKNKLRNRNKFRLPGVCPSVGDSGGEVGHEDTGVTTVGGHEQLTLDREVDGRTGRARERKAMAEGSKGGERGGGDTLPSGVPGEGVEGPEEGVEGQGEGRTGLCSGRSAALRSRMQQRLQSARFRYINEQLYTSSSAEARCMFARDSDAFLLYHQGFNTQLQSWPQNPVQNIISYIKHRPRSAVVADFGCGDCKIASSVGNTVHSFDLAALNDLVTVCDMAKVPLADESVDIAVFCLSLMGTNLVDFLMEANRVLRVGGVLKIAEVASRFEDVRSFIGALGSLGFKLLSKDTDSRFFYLFEFGKTRRPREGKLPALQLKPCLYKRR